MHVDEQILLTRKCRSRRPHPRRLSPIGFHDSPINSRYYPRQHFEEQGSGGSQRDHGRVPQWNARKLAEQVFGKGWEAKADSIYCPVARSLVPGQPKLI